jgi:hypothetical protein
LLNEEIHENFKKRNFLFKVYYGLNKSSYKRELAVLKCLFKKQMEDPSIGGSPQIVSIIEGEESS